MNFFVPGKPIPSPRPHVVRFGRPCGLCGVAPHQQVIPGKGKTAAAAKVWRRAIRETAIAEGVELIDGPVTVELYFSLPPAPSLLKKDGTLRSSTRPHPTGARDGDLDNLEKAVLDSLDGVMFGNDSAVVAPASSKAWALGATLPGVLIIYRPGHHPPF